MGRDQTRLHKKDGILKGVLCLNTLPEKSPFSGLPGTYKPNRSAQSGMLKEAAVKSNAYRTATRRVRIPLTGTRLFERSVIPSLYPSLPELAYSFSRGQKLRSQFCIAGPGATRSCIYDQIELARNTAVRLAEDFPQQSFSAVPDH